MSENKLQSEWKTPELIVNDICNITLNGDGPGVDGFTAADS